MCGSLGVAVGIIQAQLTVPVLCFNIACGRRPGREGLLREATWHSALAHSALDVHPGTVSLSFPICKMEL